MEKTTLISKIKPACVGIGIVEKQNDSLGIYGIGGSGFIVAPDGFVLTAWHVIEKINEDLGKLREEGKKVELCAVLLHLEKDKAKIFPRPMSYRYRLQVSIPNFYGSGTDYDVGLGRMLGQYQVPFLKIKKPTSLKIYDEIFVCGYPGGNITFNLNKDKSGVRTSPLIQLGRIAGLMPTDNSAKPWGVETDIIGTSGSSGSPMVETENGEVIGIVQHAVTGNVFNQDQKYLGEASIGLVWGISNYYLYDSLNQSLKVAREELDKYGRLKAEYKDRTESNFEFRVGDLEKK